MNDHLTKSEAATVECIAVRCYSVKETASDQYVTYQCIANRLQCIYDKLGIKRNLQALTKWYYAEGGQAEVLRRIGATVLLLLFSIEVSNGDFEGRVLRAPRRGRREEIEYIKEL